MKIFPLGTTFLLVCAVFTLIASSCIMASPPSSAQNSTPIHAINPTLTPDEWQELRTARATALKANPQLVKKSAELAAKLREFQQKLDTAMLKTDPSLAPYLAGYSPRFHPNPASGTHPLGHPTSQNSSSAQPSSPVAK